MKINIPRVLHNCKDGFSVTLPIMKNLLIFLVILLCACSVAQTPPLVSKTAALNTVEPTTSPAWWQPAAGSSWQIQFTGEIDTSLDVEVYDLDLFDTPASLIAELHAQGKRVICYLNAGAWEDWRVDAADFPDEVIGRDYEGWPAERWLDVADLAALAPLMRARLDLCAAKGFDGVDPDNLDGFANETGFDITHDEALAYARWLAEEAHARGLAIGIKNVPELAAVLEPFFDWALLESCFAQGWCADMSIFIEKGKPVFAIEYVEEGMTTADFCAEAATLGFSAILKKRELDGWVEFCQ